MEYIIYILGISFTVIYCSIYTIKLNRMYEEIDEDFLYIYNDKNNTTISV
jgi:hypothetical protein